MLYYNHTNSERSDIPMKKTKRFLSGLLVALCIFSICTVPAFAFVDTDDIQTHHEVLGIADEIWMIGPVIPRGPTCSQCGGEAKLRDGLMLIEQYGACPRSSNNALYWHFNAIEGQHYICMSSNGPHYNGTVRLDRQYEYCTSGNHHNFYTPPVIEL